MTGQEVRTAIKKRPLSYSSLKEFQKSPAHYVHYITKPYEPPTDAQLLGSYFDCIVLTPKDVAKRFIVAPEYDARTVDGKAIRDEFYDSAKGKTIIKESMAEKAEAMREALLNDEVAAPYIRCKGEIQKKLMWTNRQTKLRCNGYADKITPDFIMELKSASDASPDKFIRDAFSYGYPLQAAMYLIGDSSFNEKSFVHVVVEKTKPYGVAVYHATSDFIGYGIGLYSRLMQHFQVCLETDSFGQSYSFHSPTEIYDLDLPGWAKYNNESLINDGTHFKTSIQ